APLSAPFQPRGVAQSVRWTPRRSVTRPPSATASSPVRNSRPRASEGAGSASMASTRTDLSPNLEPVQAMNAAPSGFDPARELPTGFIEFLLPLHRAFTPRQRDLIGR